MKVLLPISYLGNIDYFATWINSDEVILERHESYPKQTYRNRCSILGANGVMDLTIPISRTESKLITDIRIDNSVNWRNQHWQALLSAYKSSPFFDFFEDELIGFYESKGEWLFEELYALNQTLVKLIGLKTPVSLSDDFIKFPEKDVLDLRARFKPSKDHQLYVQSPYYQVFSDKHGFSPNLSVIDLLCNEGRNASTYLRSVKID